MAEHTHEHSHEAGIQWEQVQAWTQTGILYLLGIYFVDLARPGGDLGNYVNSQNLGWLTWVGAFIFLAIAINNTFELMRPEKHDHDEHDHHDHEHDDHDHARPGSLTSWLVIGMASMPLVLGLGIPSKPLTADAITSEISSDVTSLSLGKPSTVDLPASERNILDWLRTFATAPDLTEFEGQEIQALGFVYRDARFQGTDLFMVVRFTMSCCVADARPVGLVVSVANAAEFTEDTWINVTGTIHIQNLDGVDTPVIIADNVEITSQPAEPYLYF